MKEVFKKNLALFRKLWYKKIRNIFCSKIDTSNDGILDKQGMKPFLRKKKRTKEPKTSQKLVNYLGAKVLHGLFEN
jgi:hypothetical protein